VKPYYDADGITIYHGDALEILPSLQCASASLILADPPYMIGAISVGNPLAKSGTWSDMLNSAYWFAEWFKTCRSVLSPEGFLATFGNWRSLPTLIYGLSRCDWQATNCIVWDKDWIGPASPAALRPVWELILTAAMPDARVADRSAQDLMRCKWMAVHSGDTEHPAEKPVALLERLIQIFTPRPASLVLDPFMGGGSSLEAARRTSRRYIGIETEERWCEVAAKRLSQGVLFGEAGAA
jgi:DNA modification methylase